MVRLFQQMRPEPRLRRRAASCGAGHDESETMDLHDTIRTYRLFSGSYDIVFGPVFHPGRKEAVRIANDRPGQRILEVGVGTGLSLPYFRRRFAGDRHRCLGRDAGEGQTAHRTARASRMSRACI